MEVVVLRPSEVYLVLAEPGIPESVREQIASYLFFPLGAYPSVPGEKALCRVPPSRIERIYPLVEAAHQALVQRAAERKRTTPFQASFSPGVIQYLRTLLGAWLPLPSYFAQIGYEAGLFPDEVREEDIFREGAVRHVSVNAYERDSRARQRCIEFYGTSCIVCGLNFEELYGEVGTSFIHVHHLRPLGEIGAEYEVDPRNDLRPVCPNCHAMIHRRVPAFSIEEVKAFLNESRVPSEIMRRRRT
ncbi:MAG TPA: hypothetical protein DEP84_21010 [Chloroflexi bacterium]|nr:hypothetical protein [Chloroflexota bacterium]